MELLQCILMSIILMIVTKDSQGQSLDGLDQEDPILIEAIKAKHLVLPPPVDKLYNFKVKVPNVKGQYGQPQVVEEILKGKTNGFFIEAGAYDGEALSNSLLFELQYNWTGLLVEPNPDNFEALQSKNRKAYLTDTCLSATNKATEVD
jgi:hypothetical protein